MVIDVKVLRPALTVEEAAYAAVGINYLKPEKIISQYRELKGSILSMEQLGRRYQPNWLELFKVDEVVSDEEYSVTYELPEALVHTNIIEASMDNAFDAIKHIKATLELEIKAKHYHQQASELEIYTLSTIGRGAQINFSETTVCKTSLYNWFKNRGYEIEDFKPVVITAPPSILESVPERSLETADVTNTRERDNLLKMLALATKALAESKGSAYGSEDKPNKSQIAELLREFTDDHSGLSVKNITDKISEGLKLL